MIDPHALKARADEFRDTMVEDGRPEAELTREAVAMAAAELNGSPPNGTASADDPLARAQDGAAFVLDAEVEVPAIWGADGDVLWARGEPMMLCGPQGVGKTSLTQQLALRRAGVVEGDLLGMPVEASAGRVLYIAADRPRQAARSFRRMVSEADRAALELGLIVWRGPLPFDLGRCKRGDLADFVSQFSEVSDVYMDSLKDMAVKLTDDEVGSRVNGELAELTARNVETVVDHHQRKSSADNKKPRTLADVYGSVWLTSGCGSVLLLWGEAGDAVVEASHLKQPAGDFGPVTVLHDHDAGTVRLFEHTDIIEAAREALGTGLTARSAAMQIYGVADPSRNQIEKARGKLKRHPALEPVEGSDPTAWRARGEAR